jgi:TonB family protein
MKEPEEEPVAAAESRAKKPSTVRLVIRARILPGEPPRTTIPRHTNRRTLALVLVAGAVLTLSWLGIILLRSHPTSIPAASEGTRAVESQLPATARAPGAAAPVRPATPIAQAKSSEKSVESEVRNAPDTSPSPINEVIPNVPRNAQQTIRGTIKVSVRVIVSKEGTVLTANPDHPGPSRYFEHLAIEAAKKWTFAPADTQGQRTVLLPFNFTRAGTTARASN